MFFKCCKCFLLKKFWLKIFKKKKFNSNVKFIKQQTSININQQNVNNFEIIKQNYFQYSETNNLFSLLKLLDSIDLPTKEKLIKNNYNSKGLTPLIVSMQTNSFNITKYLIEKSFNLENDLNDATPLHYSKDCKTCKMLIEKFNYNLMEVDKSNNTPYLYFSRFGEIEC
jgi:hypothetical protein